MKLPSIRQIVDAAGRSFLRFPLVILNAALGTGVALVLIDHEGPPEPTVLFSILLATVLGIPLLTAVALVAETNRWGKPASLGALSLSVLLLAAYAATIPADLDGAPQIHMLRQVILTVGLLLFVAFAPFGWRGGQNGFWQFNKSLCLRFITTMLFSGVLYAGLAIALAALDNLFGVDIPPKRYLELWAFIAGMFAVWFFLAGVPEDLDALESSADYPKVVRVFAQYILLPLVLVYFVILYAYVGKIVIEWTWPRGWVSGLILGYSATGMALFLLLHPAREGAGNGWMRRASGWFYVSLAPLVVTLFLAMYRRISEYGITEGRYLGMVLAFWLAAMTLYFLLSGTKNIRMLPGSLCAVAFAVSFGPWGAFEVSESDQVERLKALLERNAILVDGKVAAARDSVPIADRTRISSIIGYLHDIHGYDRIQPWFSQPLTEETAGAGTKARAPSVVAGMMGVEYLAGWQGAGDGNINLHPDPDGVSDVSGFDRMVSSQFIAGLTREKEFAAEGIAYRVSPDLDTLTLIHAPAGAAADSVRVAILPLAEKLLEQYSSRGMTDIPPRDLSVEASGPGLRVRLNLRSLQLHRRGDEVRVLSFQGDILYSILSATKIH